MPADIISKKTRQAFRECMTRWPLRIIRDEFDAAEVPCDLAYKPDCSGERRSLVEQYYHAVDFGDWNDVGKVLRAYEGVLARLEDEIANADAWTSPEELQQMLDSLVRFLKRNGFGFETGHITHKGPVISLPAVRAAAGALDVPELHRQLQRLQAATDDDPCLAIGTAKELVETTCKTILHARSVAFDEHSDITALVKLARKELGLLPDDIPSAAKGAEVMRRLLSNLGTVTQGLGELRNLYGTGHGKAGNSKGLTPRHARLAVGTAATLATFLLETHEAGGNGKVK